MRKYCWLLCALMFFVSVPYHVNAENTPSVVLDGRTLYFDVQPILMEGRLLVPLRGIFDALGANVSWDANTQTINACQGSTNVNLTIGSRTAYKNGAEVNLDVPAIVVSGRTLVPLRFVAEALSCYVKYDPNSNLVTIQSATQNSSQANNNAPARVDQSNLTGKWIDEAGVVTQTLVQNRSSISGQGHSLSYNYDFPIDGIVSNDSVLLYYRIRDVQAIYKEGQHQGMTYDIAQQIADAGGYFSKLVMTISDGGKKLTGTRYRSTYKWSNGKVTSIEPAVNPVAMTLVRE